MAVRHHDVYDPADKNPDNPKVEKKEVVEGTAEFWEDKTKATRAKREYDEETRRAEQGPAESPLKVKGDINLGSFNFQDQIKENQARLEQVQSEYKQQIEGLSKTAEGYRDKVVELQIKMTESVMRTQIENLQQLLQERLTKPEQKSVMEQIADLEKVAGVLGWKKIGDEEKTPPDIRVELVRLELDDRARAREFERQMKVDERNWQLQLKTLESTIASNNAKLVVERERANMLNAAPEIIGRAIGRAMMETQSGSEVKEAPKQKRSNFRIEAAVGEAGETTCPNPECGSKIAIAPTSRTAVCPNCNIRIPIDRIPANRREEREEEEE